MKIELPGSFDDVTLAEYQAWHSGKGLSVFYPDVNSLSKNVFDECTNHLNEVFSNETERFFLKLDLDKRYGFVNDWDTFETGAWIDVETYCDDIVGNAHKLMAIMYRPIKNETDKTYEVEKYEGTKHSGVFKDVPASYFNGMMAFFLHERQRLLATSARSLMGVVRVMTSQTDGDGTSSSSRWRGVSWTWKRLKAYLSSKFSRTSRSYKIRKGKRA